eukprot:scaffold948_cov106-Cylindrotheca_fusiformis.AAC.8
MASHCRSISSTRIVFQRRLLLWMPFSSSSSLCSNNSITRISSSTQRQQQHQLFHTISNNNSKHCNSYQHGRIPSLNGLTIGSSKRYFARQRRAPTTNPKKKKIMFQSLGCPRNFVDTEVMAGISIQDGDLEVTANPNDADYIVINTCGFLQSARDESKLAMEEMIQIKNNNKKKQSKKLIVTGCMVNLHKHEIMKDYPQVDSILGSGAVDKIMDAITKLEQEEQEKEENESESSSSSSPSSFVLQSSKRRSFLERGETPRFLATPPHYAYLKIAEGCKKACAFCIIPKIKGRLQSKPISQLIDEYQALLEYGVSEIILIAQDLGDYGKDFFKSSSSSSPSSNNLASLLRALLKATDEHNNNTDDVWIRLLYLYPDEITSEIMDIMESDSRICRYLDMPIQHSHDDMLRLMRRTTTNRDIKDTIHALRQRLPNIHIRTSLMVGFPGETEEHFEHLLNFVHEFQLENVGVFQYSDEPLAYSHKLPNHVSEDIKQERYDRLMQAQLDIVQRRNQERVQQNHRLHTVIEGIREDTNEIVGRYFGQCPDIDGQVILEGNPRVHPGERYWVELTGYRDYDLVGRVVVDEKTKQSA